jgi:hypothetical protein
MNTGDTLTDSQGGSWVIDALLGRGSWGRTWALRGDGGATAVLKVPLTALDFPLADDAADLAKAAARVAEAQREALTEGRVSFLPRLRATVTLPHGTGLVLERYDADLESRLAGGAGLSDVLDLCVRVLHQLANATSGGEVHGNLRPSNILLDNQGRPILTDPVLPAVAALHARLARHAPARQPYQPPQAGDRPEGGWDTWALCLILYRSAIAAASTADPRRGALAELPREGLGRVALAALKDAAASRLRTEASNQRFAARATERLGAVLNRGLSIESEPSPPFRFRHAADLLPRLVEVDDLVHPAVESASKIMLSNEADGEIFEGANQVDFSVNVGTTSGVTQEDLACGVQVQDLDAPGDGRVRIRNSRFDVKRYPSGRWRFNFVLPDVPPGRYAVRVAFMVKGSEESPKVAEGRFEVRPRPGYVPPPSPADQPPPPIHLERGDRDRQPGSPHDPSTGQGTIVPFPSRGPDHPPAPIPPGPDAPRGAADAHHDDYDEPPSTGHRDIPVPSELNERPSLHDAPRPVSLPQAQLPPPPAPIPRPDAPSGPRLNPQGPVLAPARPYEPPPGPAAYDLGLPPPGPAPLSDPSDPLLHDYPPPLPQGADLPSYDDDLRTGPPSGLDAVREQISRVFERDPFSALMAFAGSSFVLLVLLVALSRSC